jgi:2,4-dienoyl-CoA reductase-like NADH-dependent reductase (Old Yellow Enzyme family)
MTKPLLFTPITIREVTLKNRVVIAPMATYSAVDGIAQDFHFAHWGRLALGGAACVFVEATAVTDQGRICGDLGLWRSRISRVETDRRVHESAGVCPASRSRTRAARAPCSGPGSATGP